jgi:hypothetical protein
MRRLGSQILTRLGRETQGTDIAEAALVLPLMFMMLLGVFWFGQAFSIYGTITHAAREGARAAVTPACSTCAVGSTPSQKAFAAVQTSLKAAKLDPSLLQQPATPPALCSCGSTDSSCGGGSAVSCDSGQTGICVQGFQGAVQQSVQLSYPSPNGAAGVCGISVSFQYPFKFWLPLTSLNKQRILLRAQAQMKGESQ